MKKLLALAILAAVAAHADVRAQQIATGRNANVHPGIVDQFIGDPYLQRQVEPKIVCASNNTQLCVAVANDYRTVDASSDGQSGLGEGLAARLKTPNSTNANAHVAAQPDAWLGLYRTSNGGQNWLNGLLPGFLDDSSALGRSQPWYGLAAGSDGGLASDGTRFYGVGLFFNRGGTGVVGAYRLTAYNDESAHPIRWDKGFSRIIDQGAATATGRFADLPSVAAEPSRSGGECGNVYVAYTMFAGAPKGNSFIYFSKSSNCGNTYSRPVKISGTLNANQRVVITIDPRQGTPTTTGGGTIYAVWRTFTPDQIVGARSTDFGATWTPPVPITQLSGPANLCVYDQPTKGINDVTTSDDETARSLSFASVQVDGTGRLHVVWTERVNPLTGLPGANASCQPTQQPRIVYTSSVNGLVWSPRRAIDSSARCETTAGVGRAAGLDTSSATGAGCPAGSVSRPAGPQLQPVLAYNAGKLMLLYSEGRANPNTGLFLGTAGFHSGRNTQMDARAARIDPATGALLSTTQVSRYTIDATTNDIKTVNAAANPAQAKAYNRAYLPQYKVGTTPFKGDHDDFTAAETFVWDSPPHFATATDVPGTRFLAIWGGDNREALFPGGNINGDWSAYVNPGSGGVSACNAGIRNSNDYVAFVGSQLEALVNQSFKSPFDNTVVGNRDRSWAVTLRNRSSQTRIIKLTLDERGGAQGSFSQLANVDVIGNTPADPFCSATPYPACTSYRKILPHSSMTFTVFGDAPAGVAAPLRVNVIEGVSSTPATETIAAIVRLNPSPTNPAPLAGAGIGNSERHRASVHGVFLSSNANPTQGNPTQGNPTQGNPTQGNPTQGNPTQGNAGFSDYSDYSFTVSATDANTLSQYSAYANVGNAEEVDDSHLVQMIITRQHKVPTLGSFAVGCPLVETIEDQVISTITASSASQFGTPTQGNPTQGNPTQGNPTQGNPTQGNPTQGNPTQGNNTFALAPQVLPSVGESAAAAYRARAIASAVKQAISSAASDIGPDGTLTANPDVDTVHVTVRFFHCRAAAGCGPLTLPDGTTRSFAADTFETVPTACQTDPATGTCLAGDPANNLVGIVVTAGANDNNNGVVDAQPQTTTTVGTSMIATDVASFGVGGLRGGDGYTPIMVSGVPGTDRVTKALLYWHGPTQSDDPNVNSVVTFFGISQTPAERPPCPPEGPCGSPVVGTHIGVAYSNNWDPYTNSRAYRADVTSIVTGNATYHFGNFIKRNGDTITADMNGVSLIVFFHDDDPTNDRDVYIVDGNDSNGPGNGSWLQSLPGIQYVGSGAAQLQLHVADGQVFSFVTGGDDGAVKLNGTTVAPNPPADTGDIFEGDSVTNNNPNAEALWDIKTFDISNVLARGSNTLQLTSSYVFDYLSLVAAVVSVPHTAPPVAIGEPHTPLPRLIQQR